MISPFTEWVLTSAPQAQRIVASLYSGCIPAFICNTSTSLNFTYALLYHAFIGNAIVFANFFIFSFLPLFLQNLLTNWFFCGIIMQSIGVWLSLVERLVRDQEVGCSNHLTPTMESIHNHMVMNALFFYFIVVFHPSCRMRQTVISPAPMLQPIRYSVFIRRRSLSVAVQ